MKTAKELYSSEQIEKFFGVWDYHPMLEEFGDILIEIDENGYQGDSFILYKNENKYGFLTYGWGSCSGCDALQACNNIEEVQELMDALYNSIQWFDSLKSVKSYFETRDWDLDWVGHTQEFKDFKREVLNYSE